MIWLRLQSSVLRGSLVAVVLAGCAAGTNEPRVERSDVEAAPYEVVPLAAGPAKVEEPAALAAVPKLKPPPPPQPDYSERLIGLDENGAERLLGQPDYVISQQTARRWRYINRACILELFFYSDLETDQMRVLAYDVATSDPSAEGDLLQTCAAAILSG